MLMPSHTASIGFMMILAAALLGAAPEEQAMRTVDPPRWFRGNTHTHTLNSDGDSTPEAVARWYREHGYQFVVFTDDEFITPVDGLNAVIGAPGRFMVMSGQEVTGRFNTTPVHGNAEAMWDEALTAGRRLFAVADDDAHHFKRLDDPAAAAAAEYTFKGDEQYVRARIIESNGKMAWTQPAFLK